MNLDLRDQLLEILERAQALGFLGPGPVAIAFEHAAAFTEAAALSRPGRIVDLGTGGGVPGLVVAACWPESEVAMIESRRRRADHLRTAVDELGWTGRVVVVEDRAENVAHRAEWREQADLVTARGFGAPPVVAEVAAGLLRRGGVLVVSEPPEPDERRWPRVGLDSVGFAEAQRRDLPVGHFVRIEKVRDAGPDVPRRTGKPAKRPLW